MKKIDRTGEIKRMANGQLAEIIEYNNANDMLVRFEDGRTVKARYRHFKDGLVVGRYLNKNVKRFKEYGGSGNKIAYTWNGMLKRCYDEKEIKKHPTYRDCEVCEEWHNFQNFAKWYNENYYEIDGEIMCLDKDILFKNNKVYSPKTCIFVPERINSLFVKCNSKRGNYPIGVSWHKQKQKYVARLWTKEKRVWLGLFDTPEDAFCTYKEAKEKYIKQVADEYKDRIPKKLYDAMYRYKVEITD